MNILAIETSCDDTGIAIIRTSKKSGFKILSGIVSSQVEIHKKWGGVYPALAKREHQKNLVPVLEKALRKAKMFKKPDIDLIAVTQGPGLEPCLWVGINFAKALSYYWNIPIVPVNHIEAHILVNFLDKLEIKGIDKNPAIADFLSTLLPAVCLVVSGGHTQLILMKNIGKYKILGETRDDAAGECFDKCAKILGLGYPGGPAIAKQASLWKSQIPSTKSQITDREQLSISLPRPMINSKDYDFSFSGLKTAVLYNFKNQPAKIRKSKKYIQEIAYKVQQAIIDVLVKKTIKAAKDYNAKTIILGGGVASNTELRKQFKSTIKYQISNVNLMVPPKNFCTDNAVMSAISGYYNRNKKIAWQKLKAEANLRVQLPH